MISPHSSTKSKYRAEQGESPRHVSKSIAVRRYLNASSDVHLCERSERITAKRHLCERSERISCGVHSPQKPSTPQKASNSCANCTRIPPQFLSCYLGKNDI
nr:MAG TPA: hypothetical protein [Caudoviricetes sp.]